MKKAKAEGLEKYFKEDLPKWAKLLEGLLKSNNDGKGYFVGDSVSHADIHFYVAFDSVLKANKDALKDFQALAELSERVAGRERIAAWIKSRPTTNF